MNLDLVTNYSINFFTDFVGKPMKLAEPIQLKVVKKGKFKDYPHLGGGCLVFNNKSLEVIGELLTDSVQILNVEVINNDIQIKLVNVINVVDAVDYTRSVPERTLSGLVYAFKKLNFISEAVASQTIFKIPELPMRVFVSDHFRDVVLASKLKGFEFIEAWDSERTDDVEQEEQMRYEQFLLEMDLNKGIEFNWSEAVSKVEQGEAVASGHWKMQCDQNGTLQVARLGLDCKYSWSNSDIVPPILLGLKWHEVDTVG